MSRSRAQPLINLKMLTAAQLDGPGERCGPDRSDHRLGISKNTSRGLGAQVDVVATTTQLYLPLFAVIRGSITYIALLWKEHLGSATRSASRS